MPRDKISSKIRVLNLCFRDVRPRPFQTVHTVMMPHKLYLTLRCQAHRFRDAPGKAPRQRANPVCDRILLSSDNSELYVCMPKIILAYKHARRPRVEVRNSIVVSPKKIIYGNKKSRATENDRPQDLPLQFQTRLRTAKPSPENDSGSRMNRHEVPIYRLETVRQGTESG